MTDFAPLWKPAHMIAAAVARREVSAHEMAMLALAAIERANPSLGAFTDVTPEKALADAVAVDRSVAQGNALPLAGVPFAAKNLFDVEGVVTRAGSKINRENPPADQDATPVSRLRAAGGLLVGATNMGEYAFDFMGENAHDGPSLNPHDPTRMSGGSSGGSATAVAAGMVPIGLGSDTNGSIRVPASFCGLFGLKPTYGRLSRAGMFPFAPSLDHVGLLARSATDLALVYDSLLGADLRDPAQAAKASAPVMGEIGRATAGLRIAVAGGYFRQGALAEVTTAVDMAARALGVDREVEIAEADRARAAALIISVSEAAAEHLGRLRTRACDYDPHTRARFLAGTMVPATWLVAAQRFRSYFRALVQKLFETVDVVLAPATPFHALPSGTRTGVVGASGRPPLPNIGLYTSPISFVGVPSVVVPVWLPGSTLPIGVQVIAAAWREDLTLRVAYQLEEVGASVARIAERRPVFWSRGNME